MCHVPTEQEPPTHNHFSVIVRFYAVAAAEEEAPHHPTSALPSYLIRCVVTKLSFVSVDFQRFSNRIRDSHLCDKDPDPSTVVWP